MLGEVLLQLALQVLLVARKLLAIVRREVHGVLVRDVDAGNGDRAVLVHLLCELARKLDRLDVRPKSTAENPLEKGLDFLFDCAEDHVPGIPGKRC